MSLQFAFGNACSNLEGSLIQAAQDWLAKDNKHEVFVLVPNYMKFESEIRFVQALSEKNGRQAQASIRTQVFSFSRLAWYLLQDDEKTVSVSEEGKMMILRKLMQENLQAFSVFRGMSKKRGFFQSLSECVEELSKSNISSSDLEEYIDSNTIPEESKMKFQEIEKIVEVFSEAKERFHLPEKTMLEKTRVHLASKQFNHVLVLIHGFTRFSSEEIQLIETMMKQCGEVKISLLSEKVGRENALEPLELFYDSKRTAQKLFSLAKQNDVKVLVDATVHEEKNALTEKIDVAWRLKKKSEATTSKDFSIRVLASENLFEEVHNTAREIHRLVSEEGVRYKDIQLLIRNMEEYRTHLAPIFEWYNIPLVMDRKENLRNHPLIEFFQSLFQIDENYYRYEDIFRLLKTECLLPQKEEEETLEEWNARKINFRRTVDLAENYVLKYGCTGYDWLMKKWSFLPKEVRKEKESEWVKQEEAANTCLHLLQENVFPFIEKMKSLTGASEAASYFYQFLVETGVKENLEQSTLHAVEEGNIELAKNNELAWTTFIRLLEEYEQIFKDDEFSWKEFKEIFSLGMENASSGKIPYVLDSVQVISSELVQPQQSKVVFALGLTNKVLPKTFQNSSLLTVEERETLNQFVEEKNERKFFLTNPKDQNAKEEFIAYCIFNSATERIYFSYPKKMDGVDEIKISPFLDRLAGLLQVKVEDISEEENRFSVVASKRILLQNLLKSFGDEQPLSKEELRLLLQNEDEEGDAVIRTVLSRYDSKNIPVSLSKETVAQLYPGDIEASVSRFENFYNCEYKHFLSYGLKLREREVLDLDPATKGSYFHDCCELLFKVMEEQELTLSTLSDNEFLEVSQEVIRRVNQNPAYDLLDKNARMRYLKEKLENVSMRTFWALREQAKRSPFQTVETELVFGRVKQKKGIDGLEFVVVDPRTKEEKKVLLRGIVDRVDTLNIDENEYLAVIDYKSGVKDFNFKDAYYGLALQMMTYLDVCEKNYGTTNPMEAFGALYIHLQNPKIDYQTGQNVEEDLLGQFKMKGIVITREEVVDTLRDEGEATQVYPLSFKKDGSLKESKSTVFEQDFEVLKEHNEGLFVQATEKIYSGEIAMNPVREGKVPRACGYCSFKSICCFDPMLDENNYRRVEKLSKEEVINRMKGSEVNEDE